MRATLPRRPPEGELVTRILDVLPVTDRVFHDLRHTQPLVLALVQRVRRLRAAGRILIVAPNITLTRALLELGYQVELWQVDGGTLTDDLSELVVDRGPLDALLARPADADRYDVIILPYVLEAAAQHPAHVMDALRQRLHPGGALLVAYRQAGSLSNRMRGAAGLPTLPDPVFASNEMSFSWPALPACRTFGPSELTAWALRTGFQVIQQEPVLDRRAAMVSDAMGLASWLSAVGTHAIKAALPAFRDCVIATLVALPGAAESPEAPFVSVIVTCQDPTATRRLVDRMREQTYPADRLELVLIDASRGERWGPAPANRLVRAAKGDIVAFTDDSCQPAPGWIEAAVNAMSGWTVALTGPVHVDADDGAPFLDLSGARGIASDEGLFPGFNSFYRKQAVLDVGGFDLPGRQHGSASWGWENGLGHRLRARGYRASFEPTAYVYRRFAPGKPHGGWIADEYRHAVQIPAGFKAVPGLGGLRHGIFASRRTFYFDLMLAGLALAVLRRRPVFALLGLPWIKVAGHHFDLWPPRAWRPSARIMRGIAARHAVWLAGLIAGSIKARRVIL